MMIIHVSRRYRGHYSLFSYVLQQLVVWKQKENELHIYCLSHSFHQDEWMWVNLNEMSEHNIIPLSPLNRYKQLVVYNRHCK